MEEEIDVMDSRHNFNVAERVLDIYLRLEKEAQSPYRLANEYDKTVDTIYRDIKSIQKVLELKGNSLSLTYSRKEKQYQLNKIGDSLPFLVAIMSSLYGNGSFNKDEMDYVEKKIIKLFPSVEEDKLKKLFDSLRFKYIPVQQGNILGKIKVLSQAIIVHQKVSFLYKENPTIVNPLSILYHDRMYYLVASTENEEKPKTWRFDRIKQLEMKKDTFKIKNGHFKSGEFAKLSFNMFIGDPVLVRLKVANVSVEYIQRALPTATIKSQHETYAIMEVTVAGEEGILKWIFTQRHFVEVLSPQSLRERVKDTIKEMAKLYNI